VNCVLLHVRTWRPALAGPSKLPVVRNWLPVLSAVLLTLGCSGPSSPVESTSPSTRTTTTVPPATQPLRVLMLTATAGFRHDSIPAARAAVAAIAARAGDITLMATEDLTDVNATRLGATDVLIFAL